MAVLIASTLGYLLLGMLLIAMAMLGIVMGIGGLAGFVAGPERGTSCLILLAGGCALLFVMGILGL